jgi:hypothetical protein
MGHKMEEVKEPLAAKLMGTDIQDVKKTFFIGRTSGL